MSFRFIIPSFFLSFFFIGFNLFGQDSIPVKKQYKNTIRFNLTNPFIFGEKSLLLGYERIISKKQSFSVNAGRAYFPAPFLDFIDSTVAVKIGLQKEYSDKGFCFAVDYRFYLQKENKFTAPRGVYIGPYYSFSHFQRTNNWTLETAAATGTMSTNMKANIHLTGIQMGYQFVFWNRLALDLILLGPGVAFYSVETTINSGFSGDYDEELLKKLYEALLNKFPGYSRMLDEGEFEKTGSTTIANLGYRYVIHIGYRF